MTNPNWNTPLVETMTALSRAGYEKEDHLDVRWMDPDIAVLGNYMLNRSGIDHTFRIRYHPYKAWYDDDKAIAIMYGGGIDSYCALLHALREQGEWASHKIFVIHTNYGQPYFAGERAAFDAVAETLGFEERIHFVRLEHLLIKPEETGGLDWQNYIIPARNAVLAAIGASFAPRVWIVATSRGSNEEAGTPDKTTRFFSSIQRICSRFWNTRIDVYSPFFKLTKKQVVQNYLDAGGSMKELDLLTYSCYTGYGLEGDYKHCGTCYACYKRFHLFQHFNAETTFRIAPWEGPNWHAYELKENSKGR